MLHAVERVIEQVESELKLTRKCFYMGLNASGISLIIFILGKLSISPNTTTLPYINIAVPTGFAFFFLLVTSILLGWIAVYFFYQSFKSLKLMSSLTGEIEHKVVESLDMKLKTSFKSIDHLKPFCVLNIIYFLAVCGWLSNFNIISWIAVSGMSLFLLGPYTIPIFYKYGEGN